MEYSSTLWDGKNSWSSDNVLKTNGTPPRKGSAAVTDFGTQFRSPLALMVFVTLILALIPMNANAASIFLASGSNGTAWNGNCSDVSVCGGSEASACQLHGSTVVLPYPDPSCTLFLGPGPYKDGVMKLDAQVNGTLKLQFPPDLVTDLVVTGDVADTNFYLQLIGVFAFPSASNVTIDVSAASTLTYFFVENLAVSESSLKLVGPRSTISNSHFDSSSILINGSRISITDTTSTPSCNFATFLREPEPQSQPPILQFRHSNIQTLTTPLFHTPNTPSSAFFICDNSTLTTRAPNLLPTPSHDAPFYMCNVRSILPKAQTTLFSTTSTPLDVRTSLRFTKSTFTGISINIDPPIDSSQMTFDMSNTQLINCPININADLLNLPWAGTNFITQFEPNMPVILRRQNFSSAHQFSNLAYSNPNRHATNYLALNSSSPSFGNFASTSLNVSDLHLDASYVPIESVLLVSNSISANVAGATLEHVPTVSPASPSSPSWIFHSIDITNVILTPSGDDFTLEYIPSEPSKGVKLINSSWSRNPFQITINWHSTLPPPKKFGVYPLVELSGMREIGSAFDLAPKSGVDWIFLGTFTSPTFLSFVALSPNFNHSGTLCKGPVPDGFECSVDGTLYSLTSVNSPSLTLPSGSGTVLVVGNMTVHSTVVFSGAGSNLVVTGCALVDKVVLDLSKDTGLREGPMDLISQSPSCKNSLDNVELNIKLPPKDGCKKVKAIRQGSGPARLSVLIRIDTSGCNTKWIIIGAVLGSLALILVIVFLILVLHPTTRGYLPCFIKPMKDE